MDRDFFIPAVIVIAIFLAIFSWGTQEEEVPIDPVNFTSRIHKEYQSVNETLQELKSSINTDVRIHNDALETYRGPVDDLIINQSKNEINKNAEIMFKTAQKALDNDVFISQVSGSGKQLIYYRDFAREKLRKFSN